MATAQTDTEPTIQPATPLANAGYRPGGVHPLPAEQIQGYVRDGFTVVRGLVPADLRDVITAELTTFAVGGYPTMNDPIGDDSLTPQQRVEALLAVHFPHWVSQPIADMMGWPPLADVLGQLVGAHLPAWDGRVKGVQSMLFVKGPGLPGQAWHQDEHFIPTRDRSLCGAWIALDDATIDNGCLWVVPGSHRSGMLYPTRPHGTDEYDTAEQAFDPTAPDASFDDAGAVPVEVAAGDVVLFNGYLLHKSLRNRTARYRRALVNHYCNASSELPWNMLGGVSPEDQRMIVPITGEDPYAWKGVVTPPATVFLRPSR